MKQMKIIEYSLPVALFLFFSVLSCKKTDQIHKSKSHDYKTFADVASPSVNNGILEFTNREHFDDWFNYLEAALERDTMIADDTTSIDSTLHAIELGLGFNSLRQKTHEEFEALNETGWDNVEDIPSRHWSDDLTLQSILNQYEEVKIGDIIYNFIDAQTVIKLTDISLLQTVRDFKTSSYSSVHDIFLEPGVVQSDITVNDVFEVGNLDIDHSFSIHEDGSSRASSKGTSDDYEYIYGTLTYSGCPAQTHLSGYYVKDPNTGSKVSASYSIDWGDNSSIQYLGTSTGLNTSHTYAQSGKYTILIYANISGSQAIMREKDKEVPAGGCGTSFKHQKIWYYPVSGFAMRAIIESPSGYLQKTKASSESFKWQNGKWRKRKGDNLYVKCDIEYYDRTNMVGCANSSWDNRTRSSNNAKEVDVNWSVLGGGSPGWKTIIGTHAIYINGNWHQYSQYMYPCN